MSSDTPAQRIVLARHAETEWSISGQHTGRSDIPLTESGRESARQTGERLRAEPFTHVLSSPLQRAAVTAELAGFGEIVNFRDALQEWDYGDYEGLTHEQIRGQAPGWELWRDGAPGGESPAEVRTRVDSVVEELVDVCEHHGNVLIFGHGHLLRALAVRWVGLPIEAGQFFRLDTGTISRLGWKRELRVIDIWNDASHLRSRT